MYYYNKYEDNCNCPTHDTKRECNCNKHEDHNCDNNHDTYNRQKCCWKVTEFCCYPSYFNDDKDEKCCCKKHVPDCDRKDRGCEPTDNNKCPCCHDHDEKENRRPCRPCCPIFRN